MTSKEMEARAGVPRANIRYYEAEGLLCPRREKNGYRDYSEEDQAVLKKIKLLRMLDVPIEEILRLKNGSLTLEDAMGRHMIQLGRRQANLTAMETLCGELRDSRCRLDDLDADEVLSRMERQEQEGTKFMNVKRQDNLKRYVGPVAAAVLILALMGGLIALMVWAFTISPEEAPPLGVIIGLAAIPMVVILGVLLALFQRIKQIKGGEEDAASQY